MDGEFSKGAGKRDGSGSASEPHRGLKSTRGFPAHIRLRRTVDYERIYGSARPRSSPHFTCYSLPNNLGYSRFGITVRASAGSAVRRNRIKRRVREWIRLHRQELPAGWDIAIHPKSEVATGPFAELGEELVALLQRALRS